MKQYFLQVNCYIPKNKAHDFAQSFAIQYHKCLIDEPLLQQFITDLKNEVAWINKEFTRCQDIKVTHYVSAIDEKIHLYIESNFVFSVTEVMRYELVPKIGRDPILDHYGDMKADAY